jgi:glutaminyl-tRNA synthetase
MAVLEPIKVFIQNYPYDSKIEISVPNFPNDESKGTHTIYFDQIVYIDASDFIEVTRLIKIGNYFL